jgi:hypothetical protein
MERDIREMQQTLAVLRSLPGGTDQANVNGEPRHERGEQTERT